jgi:hypothetical protein
MSRIIINMITTILINGSFTSVVSNVIGTNSSTSINITRVGIIATYSTTIGVITITTVTIITAITITIKGVSDIT